MVVCTGRILFKETHKGFKHKRFPPCCLVCAQGMGESQIRLDVSLRLHPSVHLLQEPCRRMPASYCSLSVACSRGEKGLSAFFMLGGHGSLAPLHGITQPLWCLVVRLGSTPLRTKSAGTQELPFPSLCRSKSATPQVPVQGSLYYRE